jgi:signal peptidase
VGSRGTAAAELTLSAPDETGYYRRYVTEHRYLLILPVPVIDALYDLHPWLPIVAVDSVLASVVALLGLGLLRGRRVRVRRRESRHSRTLGGRLRRRLR